MIKIKANICTTCPKLTSACSNLARTRTPRIYVFVCLFCSCIVGGKYLLSKLVMESFLFQANHRSVSLRWWPALGIVSAYHMIKKNSIVPHFPTCQAALRGKQAKMTWWNKMDKRATCKAASYSSLTSTCSSPSWLSSSMAAWCTKLRGRAFRSARSLSISSFLWEQREIR